ncbi:GtrA family protein [Ruegeria sp.]|uniref:GtrA family protein n=1 Tax=Ruegeria sp. TaxID=1879320 RepID=UPI003B5AF3EC
MTRSALVLRYTAFAIVATVVNLAAQRLVLLQQENNLQFGIALAVGTLAGLVVKYILDKHWIFYDSDTGLKQHGKKFSLYTTMGIFTTCIFWGFETAFWVLWKTDIMRELGAVIGLSIGYVVKYNLDKRYVFSRRAPEVRR